MAEDPRLEVLNTVLEENKIRLSYLSGKGVLLRTTKVLADSGGFSFRFEWKSVSFRDGVAQWRKDCDRMIRMILEETKIRQDEKDQKMRDALSPFAGNFLAEDIVDCVQKNDGGITSSALVQSLRGTKVRLESGVHEGKQAGKYNLCRPDDILRMERALAQNGVIRERFVKGWYQNYNVLCTTDYTGKLEGFGGEADEAEAESTLREGGQITDRQAQAVFDHLHGKAKNLSDWMLLLKLAASQGFVCRNGTHILMNSSQCLWR